MRHTLISAVGLAAALAAMPAAGQAPGKTSTTAINIPSALRTEHAEIHQRLEAAARLRGKTGEGARALVAVLHPHFVREEQIALPPLGLLDPLARGRYDAGMSRALPMTDALARELPRMLDEHKRIAAATRKLASAARQEKQAAALKLAEELLLHAQTEEQVMYPAAILVGEIVRARARPRG